MNEYSAQFKERFLSVLASDPFSDVNAIYFSGGVDSTTILFGLLELGRKPDLVSFNLDGIPSKDVEIGSAIAKHHGLNYHLITLGSDDLSVINDVKAVMPYLKYPLKTHIQCSIPFLYMATKLIELGHHTALVGLGAGDIFGLNKKTAIAYKEHGEDYTRQLRYDSLFNNPKISDYDIYRVSEAQGVAMHDPYREFSFNKWMLDVPFESLHVPKKKSIAVDAFNKYWKLDEEKWYRPGDQLQIVSGIRKLHDAVFLDNPEINTSGAKGIIKVYNQMRRDNNT